MVVTSGLTAALALAHGIAGLRGNTSGPTAPGDSSASHPVGWFFVPFLAYAAANVAGVSPVPWLGWIDWFGWVQAFVVFWVVLNGLRTRGPRQLVWATLFVLACGSVFLGAYQHFVNPNWLMLHRVQAAQYAGRASGFFGIPNSMAALLLLLLPTTAALALRRGASMYARVFFGWLALVLLMGLGLTISRGAWLGFALALAAWPLLGHRWPLRRRLAGVAGMLVLVGAAGVLTFLTSPTVHERLTQLIHDSGERSRPILWRAALQLARAHPVVGSGGGSFNVMFEHYRPEGFLNEPLWAHNDYLNTLSDYGSVGFVLLFGAVTLTMVGCLRHARSSRCDRRDVIHPVGAGALRTPVDDDRFHEPFVRQALAVGLLAFALQLFVDFHFKIPALAMSCAVVGAFAVQSAWRCEPRAVTEPHGDRVATPRRSTRLLPAFVFIGLAAVIAVLILPIYRAEALRESARERLDRLVNEPATSARYREQVMAAATELEQAVQLAPEDGRAWADKAYAAAQRSRVEVADVSVLGRQAEMDADRAIAVSTQVAEFWIRRGVARDMQGKWDAAGDDFTKAIELAPRTPLPWFHYGYHLSLRPTGTDLAPVMVETCLRLDPQNPDGLRLRHQLATGRPRP